MAAPRSGAAAIGALAFAVLVLYASLYPFEGWRWPPGRDLADMLALPWPRWRLPFDLWANFLGYLPLGALVCLALPRRAPWRAIALGALLPTMLSYGAEVAQHFLPGRHPSLLDLALNSGGAAVGALTGQAVRALGWVDRWRGWMAQWFERQSVAALALLAAWPLGLLFPAPVALGLGQVGPRLRPWLAELLADVPWAEPWQAALAAKALPMAPPTALTEAAVTMLGLLAPCLVAFSVVAPGWRRAALTGGALTLAVTGAGCRDPAGTGAGAAAAQPDAGARADRADRARGPGGAGADRPLPRPKPERLGAGPLHPPAWRGAVDRLALALRGDGLAAGAPGHPGGAGRCLARPTPDSHLEFGPCQRPTTRVTSSSA